MAAKFAVILRPRPCRTETKVDANQCEKVLKERLDKGAFAPSRSRCRTVGRVKILKPMRLDSNMHRDRIVRIDSTKRQRPPQLAASFLSCRQKCDGQNDKPSPNDQGSHGPGGYFSFLFCSGTAHSASRFALEPYPSSYFVVCLLRLLVQFQPDLIAIATFIKHQVSYPKGDGTKQHKSENAHSQLPSTLGKRQLTTLILPRILRSGLN
jgi:hypothetical protein